MFNGYCAFVHILKKAKSKLRIVLYKTDMWIKQRTIKNWIKNVNNKTMHNLTDNQALVIDEIENKSRVIGQCDQTL